MKKLLTILVSLCLLCFQALSLAASPHYALIIDAGSTGSRIHLFEYTTETKVPVIHDIFSESIKPGLSSYENKPQGAGASLKQPLEHALVELHKRQVDPATVTISVLGTAGMRLLPVAKQEAIYNNVSLYVKNNSGLVLGEVKTLPGNLEGLFGWLDVNYLLKSFNGNSDHTKGSIDVGGASTQIVFSTSGPSKAEDELTLKIGDLSYTIFSKSFLGLGLVEALNQVTAQPLGATCYPAHYPVTTTIKGSFNFASCGNLYLELINQHQVREQLPPLDKMTFIAYSGAYYTDNFFEVDKTPSKAVVEKRVQEVCNQPWEQLVAAYPKVSEQYLSMYCANGAYLSQLFYESYQLQEQQLTVSNQINQQDLDWTLGALLYQLVKD